jgi:transcriptional regulator with XRE-family HTH domain
MAVQPSDPDPQWAAWQASMDRRSAELRRARASRRARRSAAIEVQRAAGERLRPGTVDGAEVDALVGLLRSAVGASLRAGRRRHCLSQRELARRLGVSPSTVARLESGRGQPRLADVVRALAAVGGRLVLERAVHPTRMAGDYVRDQAGRRLPAHLEQYCLEAPHTWWPGTTDSRYWHREPTWSYRRRPPPASGAGRAARATAGR